MDNNLHQLKNWLTQSTFYATDILHNHQKIQKIADRKALALFHRAAEEVPAYRDFLKKHKVNHKTIKTIADFQSIPITTKENYVTKYSIAKRVWHGKLANMHMISTSSGTTGEPHFWPRDLQTEIEGAMIHELLFRDVLHIDKKRTLLVNGFAMGNWIAGTFTMSAAQLVALKGYPLTVMTPGYDGHAIVELLKTISPLYEQTIICGHTPFLKEIIDMCVAEQVALKELQITLLGAGQGVSENWRAYILGQLEASQLGFINLYGSADAALMGFETPRSISLRGLLSKDTLKAKQLFADERMPSLYNFDPRLTYFEAVNNELCITKYTGAPLIRYNMHDQGGIIPFKDMQPYVSKTRLKSNKWQLPFVYLFGREKFMVKIYGANIYTEHVQQAFDHQTLQHVLTGRFFLETTEDDKQNQILVCRVEMQEGLTSASQHEKVIRNVFVAEVAKLNSEYNFLLKELGTKVKPHIKLYPFGHETYFPKGRIKKTA